MPFPLTIEAVVVFVGPITTVAGFTVYFGWQIIIAICFVVMAATLLFADILELIQD